jgi:mannonate dehydratase
LIQQDLVHRAHSKGRNEKVHDQFFLASELINHVHFRNPHIMKPYVKYDEGFIDEGDVNLFAAMRELLRVKYTREVYPEHPRALDYDRSRGPIQGYPGGGGYAGDVHDLAYARAMLQAALVDRRAIEAGF